MMYDSRYDVVSETYTLTGKPRGYIAQLFC